MGSSLILTPVKLLGPLEMDKTYILISSVDNGLLQLVPCLNYSYLLYGYAFSRVILSRLCFILFWIGSNLDGVLRRLFLLGKNNFLMRETKFDKLEICELLQGKRRKRIESLKMEHILVYGIHF